MVSLRNKDKHGDMGNKRGSACDDSVSTPNKRTRSVNEKDSPGQSSPASSKNRTPESAKTQKVLQDHTDTPMPNHETPVKRHSLRSSHLLVTPAPEVLTPRRSRRLSTDSSDIPQVQTPIRRSRRLSTDASEDPPQVQTPVRRSRRLSTDLTENLVEVQTPTRRSRRLSTDLTENPPQLETPTRRSRRLSTDLNENPPHSQTTTRRTRRSSTDIDDALDQLPTSLLLKNSGKEAKEAAVAHRPSSVTHIEVLKSRSKILSSDVSKSPAPKVQTPTRRSRRLSTDLVDIPEDDQTPAETEVASQSSRRLSGKRSTEPESVCEKPLSIVEEVEEEKDDDGGLKMLDSATKNLTGKVNKAEKETELQIIEEEDEVIVLDDEEESTSDISSVRQECNVIEEKSEDDIEILPKGHVLNEEDKTSEDEEEDIKLILEEETASNKSHSEIAEILEKNSCTQRTGNRLQENKDPLTHTKSVSESNAVTNEETVDSITASDAICIRSEMCDNKEKENSQTVGIVPSSLATVTDIKDKESLKTQENQPLSETKNIKSDVNKNDKESLNNNDEELKPSAIRGKPVSGRWWKKENKRFTSIMKDQGIKSSWAIKMKRKQELKDMLAMKTAITEEKKRKKAELRERQKLNTLRREENARKSEIVQVIKDSRKIKKMKRKQLRYIETRDTTLLKKA